MGMVNYLSAYVPHLATVAALLTRLCGSTVPWKWTNMHDVSFKTVKDIISAKGILQPINYDAPDPIFLITDASATGIRAWIGQGPSMHDIRPAVFYSRKFKNAENWYSVTDKELLAIIEGLEHFQPQLTGTRFTILTDHKAAVHFLQEYGILPHSRTYYCLLFSLYHMFIIFIISY